MKQFNQVFSIILQFLVVLYFLFFLIFPNLVSSQGIINFIMLCYCAIIAEMREKNFEQLIKGDVKES